MKQNIQTRNAPAAIGPYSQAIKINDWVFLSGQLGINSIDGNLVKGGVTEQTEQIFRNIRAVLAESGLSLDNVVKTTVFLADMANFAAMNMVYEQQFLEPYPARSTVAVKALPKNGLVEIEIVAHG